MTPILDRIRANGGEVVREKWNISIRRGRLTVEAIAWVKTRKDDLMLEVWPDFDRWVERAAIREFDGGQSRADAEQSAYDEVMGC